jgi:hypothetical protein
MFGLEAPILLIDKCYGFAGLRQIYGGRVLGGSLASSPA